MLRFLTRTSWCNPYNLLIWYLAKGLQGFCDFGRSFEYYCELKIYSSLLSLLHVHLQDGNRDFDAASPRLVGLCRCGENKQCRECHPESKTIAPDLGEIDKTEVWKRFREMFPYSGSGCTQKTDNV